MAFVSKSSPSLGNTGIKTFTIFTALKSTAAVTFEKEARLV